MGLHTKKLDSIINKLIPKEILPFVLSDRIEKSVILEKMRQIEKDIQINEVNEVHHQWVARWIKLKCWLELYGE